VSTRYESFLPEVVPYVHDVAEFVAVNAVRNACIEFCRQTQMWLYVHDPISSVVGVGTYDITPPEGATPVQIVAAWYDEARLIPVTSGELRENYNKDWTTETGTPCFFTHNNPTDVELVPTPDTAIAGALRLHLALCPTRDSVEVDDNIYQYWAEVIGYGARSRLYDTPNQPYYDPTQAMNYASKFKAGIDRAVIERNKGLTRRSVYVRMPRIV